MSKLLLPTKLYLPPVQGTFMARSRLIELLNQGLAGKLTLVSAPAGFGKTSLLAAWVKQAVCERANGVRQPPPSHDFAWVSLDEHDNDLTRFLTYLTAALQKTAATLGHTALSRLQSTEAVQSETILTILINDLSQLEQKVVLILDDYHFISSPAIHTALLFLLEHLPPQLHLVIASRSDPPLALARWRVRGELNEIRAADLRFTAAETNRFLQQALTYPLPEQAVQRLMRRTEGWAAGLQLAALSLRELEPAAADHFVTDFGGTNRHIFAYLVEEVLQRHPPFVQRFLLQTTLLERLTASLCDAVTGIRAWDVTQEEMGAFFDTPLNSQALLTYLSDHNLFVIPLDGNGRWFRYHTFFAETLQARLRKTEPELMPELHRRASRWYAAQGDTEQAIHHALAAQAFDTAADLIEAAAERLWTHGQLGIVLKWLTALPETIRLGRLRLGLLQAWLLFLHDRWAEATHMIAQVAQQLDTLPADDPERGQHRGRYAAVQGVMAAHRQEAPTAISWMETALDHLPPEDIHWRQVALLGLGLAQLAEGNAAAALDTLHQTALTCERHNDIYLAFAAWWHQMEACWAQGSLHEAAACLQRIEHLAERDEEDVLNLAANAAVGRGMLAYERNELATAEQQLTAALPRIWPGGQPRIALQAHLTLARLAQARDDPETRQHHLDAAAQLVRQFNLTAEQSLLAATTARLLLAEGQMLEAYWQLESQNIGPALPPEFQHERGLLTLVRLYLAEHRPEEALTILAGLRPPAEAAERHGSLIEIDLLQALALAQHRQPDSALAALNRALTLAAPERFGRIFIDEGRPLAHLLRQLTPRTPYVAHLLAQMEEAPAVDPLVDPLTDRELEILHLVADGASNREIAERLVIAVGTVKGHLNHILSKLEAQNRTEAVALGRELGLL